MAADNFGIPEGALQVRMRPAHVGIGLVRWAARPTLPPGGLPNPFPAARARASSRPPQAIRYSRGKLELLDQRLLPLESIFIDVNTSEAAWHAIKARKEKRGPGAGPVPAEPAGIAAGRGPRFSAAASDADRERRRPSVLRGILSPTPPSPPRLSPLPVRVSVPLLFSPRTAVSSPM